MKKLTIGLLVIMVLVPFIALSNAKEALALTSGDYEYTDNGDGTATIFFYIGSDTDIVIPSELDGLSVTTIGEAAFNWRNLTGVVIPDSVTSIDRKAFNNNLLTQVSIPSSVTRIGEEAFTENPLDSVTILNKDVVIDNLAFVSHVFVPSANFTIIGHDPSTAKDHADKHRFNFQLLESQIPTTDTDDSQDVGFNLEGGDLSLFSSPIQSFGNIKLKAQPEVYKTSFTQPLNIKDLRGTQEGWRLDVSATQFEVVKPSDGFASGTSAYKLPKGSLSLTPLANISRVGPGTGNLPTSKLSNNTVIDDGSVTVASAGQGEGMGEFSLTFPNDALSFVVDATTAKVDKINYPDGGTPYEATITWNLVSAP